jgi:hypothetical protein
VTEQEIQRQAHEMVEQAGNREAHLASTDCADELATLAMAEWMHLCQGRDNENGRAGRTRSAPSHF